MKKGFQALCLIVFGIGALSLSLAWGKKQNDIEPSRPFVVVYYEAESTPDGHKTITSWRTRFVKANSEFKIVMHGSDEAAAFADSATGPSETSSTVIVGMPEGVYVKPFGSTERKSVSPAPVNASEIPLDTTGPEKQDKQFHSHSFLRNHPEFVRMDKVAGFEVYVLKVVTPEYWVENCYSPLTGRIPLRSVLHQLNGTEYITETAKIEFRDVPENLNDDIKALPNTGYIGDKSSPLKPSKSN
jgi:hypothetical protein